jgi:lysophospholipase L1-like esterase
MFNKVRGLRVSFLLILFCEFTISLIGQFKSFSSGDKIIFIGNSITHAGDFHHNVMLYHLTRFPDKEVNFYNAGISGDVTSGILNRLDDDILKHVPTKAFIMIGMNDVRRDIYSLSANKNKDTIAMQDQVMVTYEKNLETIIQKLQANKIEVALQRPSIYDQTGQLKRANNYGVNDGLGRMAKICDRLALKYQIRTIDYYGLMSKINANIQKSNPKATIVSEDRVHPGPVGHFVMHYQFLKQRLQPELVSKIIWNSKSNSLVDKSLNCKLISNTAPLTFTVLESGLPFPVLENQKEALSYVPFTKEFNQEILIIKSLDQGKYKVMIDNTNIGIYDDRQLKKGINLAEISNTPQYEQSLNLRRKLEELWEAEAGLRLIKWAEYGHLGDYKKSLNNMEDIKQFLDNRFKTVFSTSPYKDYIKSQYDKYLTTKPKENSYLEIIDRIRKEIYQINKPVNHTFRLVRI